MVLGSVFHSGLVSSRAPGDRRRGIAAVEMAVCAAFLVSLVFAIFELGRGIMVKQALTDSAAAVPASRPNPGQPPPRSKQKSTFYCPTTISPLPMSPRRCW